MKDYSETIRARDSQALLVSWPWPRGSFNIQSGSYSAFHHCAMPVGFGRLLTRAGVRRLRAACDKFLKECDHET